MYVMKCHCASHTVIRSVTAPLFVTIPINVTGCHCITLHMLPLVPMSLCVILCHCVDEGGGGSPRNGGTRTSPPDIREPPASPTPTSAPSTVHGLAVALERGLQRSPSSEIIHPTQLQSGEQGVCVCVCVRECACVRARVCVCVCVWSWTGNVNVLGVMSV